MSARQNAQADDLYLGHALTDRLAEFVQLRRDLHAHPERPFAEHRTAALVAAKLQGWGYEVSTGIGGTGVVGRLRRGTSKKALGLRADMDALPITEASGRAWSSTVPGMMHACGHDGHTATLLAAARLIAKDVLFNGTLNLIFQPGEEGEGGAQRMIDDGLFERFPCNALFSLHNMPGIETGHLHFRPGAMLTSSDRCTITVRGTGGHSAFAHQGADPVVAGASIVMALQTVVSRNVDPLRAAAITVSAFHAGQAFNVIPGEAELRLSARALDPGVRRLLKARINDLVHSQAASYQCRAELAWCEPGYAVLANSPDETALAIEVATRLYGPERVTPDGEPIIASEEGFSAMLAHVPGCYFFIGNGAPGTPGACMVHNAGYDFDDDNIEVGARLWMELTREYLR